jgi:WhiB family transcriptional regulator, redox-sensing transcriptional regulator
VISAATGSTTTFEPTPVGTMADLLDPLSKQAPPLPCRTENSELWFAEKPVELEMAKAFCHQCPARLACLQGALERRELWGVWGGEIFDRGRILPRKRPRGRPRKEEQAQPVVAA